MNWGVVGASILPALLAGTEIGLITAASAGERGWGNAWLTTAAGLITMVPIAAVLYLIFTHLPHDILEYAAGGTVCLLGLYFVIKGFRKRHKTEEKESEGLTGGMLASYIAVVGEGVEMTLGLIRPLLSRIPEWSFQLTVGFIMDGHISQFDVSG